VQTLSRSCFAFCSSLTECCFEAGSRLKSIGESAFACCDSLKSICLPASIQSLERDFIFKRVIFESGASLQQILKRSGFSGFTEIYVPTGDRALDYHGYVASDSSSVSGFVLLVKAVCIDGRWVPYDIANQILSDRKRKH
jgi:hypothetical protein